MLKKVHISNFLSCQDTEIELDGITALIGRNAAGKTNILKAIEWCAQFAVGNVSLDGYISQSFMTESDRHCSIEFLINDETFKYEIKIKTVSNFMDVYLNEYLSRYIDDEWVLISKRDNESATQYYSEGVFEFDIKSNASLISSILSFIPKIKLNPIFNKVFGYLSGVNYYSLDDDGYKKGVSNNLSGFVSNVDYRQWLTESNEEKSSVVMRLLHLWHEDKETLDELQALIGESGLNLVNNIAINELDLTPQGVGKNQQQDHNVIYVVTFNVANAFVNFNQLSYGTQRVLILLLALLYDKNSTLLIEQPEDGIHSGLLKKLLPLCFEYATVYNKQIIIATHSPDVINLLPPESIRLVRMTEKGTKVAALNKDQIPMIRDYMKHEGALFDFIKSMNDE